MAAGGDAFKICCRRCDDKGWYITGSDIELVVCKCHQPEKKSLLTQFLNWVFK